MLCPDLKHIINKFLLILIREPRLYSIIRSAKSQFTMQSLLYLFSLNFYINLSAFVLCIEFLFAARLTCGLRRNELIFVRFQVSLQIVPSGELLEAYSAFSSICTLVRIFVQKLRFDPNESTVTVTALKLPILAGDQHIFCI